MRKYPFIAVCVILCTAVLFAGGIYALPVSGVDNEVYRVPVIMYHAVMKDPARSGNYVITPGMLRDDIEYILSGGYTPVFITDLINFAEYGSPLPDRPVVLSFDDGYYNNYLYAYPITKEMGVKAVLSVIGIHTHNQSVSGQRQSESYSHISWDQLREMTGSGLWEVQNHTYDMHNTGKQNGILAVEAGSAEKRNSIIRDDISKLQDMILCELGTVPNTFTYPFGSFDENTVNIIDEMGFKASLSCTEGINEIYKGADLHLLYRYNRPASVPTKEFFDTVFSK